MGGENWGQKDGGNGRWKNVGGRPEIGNGEEGGKGVSHRQDQEDHVIIKKKRRNCTGEGYGSQEGDRS